MVHRVRWIFYVVPLLLYDGRLLDGRAAFGTVRGMSSSALEVVSVWIWRNETRCEVSAWNGAHDRNARTIRSSMRGVQLGCPPAERKQLDKKHCENTKHCDGGGPWLGHVRDELT